MVDYTLVYKLLHLLGMVLLLLAFGGLILHAIVGGSKRDNPFRKPAIITHGLGMFLVLLGGFGMLARLGIHWPWPLWVYGKVVIWIVLGGLPALVYKSPATAKKLWIIIPLLAFIAACLAVIKPA